MYVWEFAKYTGRSVVDTETVGLFSSKKKALEFAIGYIDDAFSDNQRWFDLQIWYNLTIAVSDGIRWRKNGPRPLFIEAVTDNFTRERKYIINPRWVN